MTAWNKVKVPVYAGDVKYLYYREVEDGGRVVFDGVTSGTTISSGDAAFVSDDVGKTIFGTNIPLATTISAVASDGGSATMSQSATADVSGNTVIVRGVDVSAYTWEAQIRATTGADTVLASWTIDDTNAASGEVELSLPGETTADLPATCVWDLQGTAGGEVTTVLKGTIVVEAEVTR